MAQTLLSNKLRRSVETRFRRHCRVTARQQRQPLRRRDIDLQVARMVIAFEEEMRAKPEELKKLELEIRGLVAPPPMIANLKDVGREQLKQRTAAEARKIVIANR